MGLGYGRLLRVPYLFAVALMLLNLAIGGTQGGDPSKTPFPARFEADYVRVYQRSAPAK